MIASLRGVVADIAGPEVVVEVQGIGYLVTVPDRSALRFSVGEELHLHTAMVVRDDHVAIFGFETREELGLFGLLRSVNGVGPKMALAVLGHMTPGAIHDAVLTENDAAFRAVSGVGAKTAKLIVLSLQGAFDHLPTTAGEAPVVADISEVVKASVVQALVGLGWSEKIARGGVEQVLEAASGEPVDASTLLREALSILGPQTNREPRR
ncbi:MAG: Holliday junction branch migration protein RuvA [Pontimonas sp.]|nr:Holliday junction branch migration protein RuvA [Pontimonas sp.]MDP4688205.1 Holliday junction branch migration protein RuvA [Pontimonas sp.]MDP4816500.1 Holliday junction branch migration protein RuvA [Pontimonas sp.]MDP4972666.1 Holliday junction branch migration protein RuvA [Pontimonas sp.]MDP5128504.1 Holliday junction branch migration protein RuvA [Pontimonas sp.]